MKRKVALIVTLSFFVALLMLSTPVYAAKRVLLFPHSTTAKSVNTIINPIEIESSLGKRLDNNGNINYRIDFDIYDKSKRTIQNVILQIDEQAVQIPVSEFHTQEYYYYNAGIDPSTSHLEIILKATTLTLTLNFVDGPPVVLDMSPAILSEWKEIIEMDLNKFKKGTN